MLLLFRGKMLQDCGNYFGIAYKICSKLNIQLNYHYFTVAVKLPDLHKKLGSEVDY